LGARLAPITKTYAAIARCFISSTVCRGGEQLRHEPDQQARKFHLFQELSNIDQRLWNPEGNVCSSSLVFGIHR